MNDDNKPVQAEISLTDFKGDTVLTGRTQKDGTYDFIVPLARTRSYSLNFYSDSNVVFSRNVTLKDSVRLKKLSTVLPKLKKEKKYSVGSSIFTATRFNTYPLPCRP